MINSVIMHISNILLYFMSELYDKVQYSVWCLETNFFLDYHPQHDHHQFTLHKAAELYHIIPHLSSNDAT